MLRRNIFALFISATLFASDQRPLVTAVDSIGVTVSNLDRSVDFYTKLLSFEKVSEYEAEGDTTEHLMGVFGLHTRTARLRLGDEFLELTEYLTPKGRAIPEDSRSNDKWFQHVAIIVSDMDRAYRWLRDHQVQHASPSPQRLPEWNKNAAGIQAFYFKDPDGHNLEILAFPADKGNAKWHRVSDKLFLGIDHTAIVISETDASLKFYRDVLGLSVAGESDNYGPEQERLNNVFGAHLRITAVRAASGPGVEFLEYLAPSDGRPYPSSKPNDLVHWHTRFSGTSADDAARALRKFGSAFISSGVVRRSFLARDPDGHAVEFVEP